MILNFIAFVICVTLGICRLLDGDLGWFMIEITLAILNLPYAIKWLIEFFSDGGLL